MYTIRIPTQEQFQIVIDNLKKAVELAKGDCPVDMSETGTNKEHPCGSPMCHGGWYAVAAVHKNPLSTLTYISGAHQMAKDLGFEKHEHLERWAKHHPAIWGNDEGNIMFANASAFGAVTIEQEDDLTLYDIVLHWEGVKERAKIAERNGK